MVEEDDEQANTKVTAMMTGVRWQGSRDQQRADAGMRKICSVTMAPPTRRASAAPPASPPDSARANHVLDDDLAFVEALGSRGRDIVEADDVKHRGTNVAGVGRRLNRPEHVTGMIACLKFSQLLRWGDIGAIDERQPAEIGC